MKGKIWDRNYLLQRTSNKFKKEIKNGKVVPAHVEYAKGTSDVLALLTKNWNIFSSRTPLL